MFWMDSGRNGGKVWFWNELVMFIFWIQHERQRNPSHSMSCDVSMCIVFPFDVSIKCHGSTSFATKHSKAFKIASFMIGKLEIAIVTEM